MDAGVREWCGVCSQGSEVTMYGMGPGALTEMSGLCALCKARTVALLHLTLPLQTFLWSVGQWVSCVLGDMAFQTQALG